MQTIFIDGRHHCLNRRSRANPYVNAGLIKRFPEFSYIVGHPETVCPGELSPTPFAGRDGGVVAVAADEKLVQLAAAHSGEPAHCPHIRVFDGVLPGEQMVGSSHKVGELLPLAVVVQSLEHPVRKAFVSERSVSVVERSI